MILDFNKYATDGNHFISRFAEDYGCPGDRNRGARVLKAVLHAIRNHLTTTENLQLLAQLPMFLKAVYVEGWTARKGRRIKHYHDLLDEIRQIDRMAAAHDFPNEDDVDRAVSAVFKGIRNYVSLGEIEDIKTVLPKELKPIVNEVLMV